MLAESMQPVARAEAVCLYCASVFMTDDPWKNQFCDADCRTARESERERARDASRAVNPVRILYNRDKSSRWIAAHRVHV